MNSAKPLGISYVVVHVYIGCDTAKLEPYVYYSTVCAMDTSLCPVSFLLAGITYHHPFLAPHHRCHAVFVIFLLMRYFPHNIVFSGLCNGHDIAESEA